MRTIWLLFSYIGDGCRECGHKDRSNIGAFPTAEQAKTERLKLEMLIDEMDNTTWYGIEPLIFYEN